MLLRRSTLLILWLISGAVLLAFLGRAPCQSTQEARVLETGREMLGGGWRAWMVPHLNGQLRLRKPPLAYWAAAGGFKAMGVGEAAGRVPFALAAWLCVGATYACAGWLFGRRAGLASAAALAGSYMFVRYARVAEIEMLVTLFVTVAIWATWRGMGIRRVGTAHHTPTVGGAHPTTVRRRAGDVSPLVSPEYQRCPPANETSGLTPTARHSNFAARPWFALGGLSIGLAALAKGLPALYPLLFLGVMLVIHRRARPLLGWAISGAPLIAAGIGLSWFAYIRHDPALRAAIARELDEVIAGRDHPGSFLLYFPQILLAMLPWTPFVLLGLGSALARCRRDERLRGLLVWVGVVLVPLCFIGNKQFHYLLTLMPPLAILAGWAIEQSLLRLSSRAGAPPQPSAASALTGGAPDRAAPPVRTPAALKRPRPKQIPPLVRPIVLATSLRYWRLVSRRPPASLIRALSIATLLTGVVAGLAVIATPTILRLHGFFLDLALGLTLIWGVAVAGLFWARRGLAAGLALYAGVCALALPLLIGAWLPSLNPHDARAVAAQIRAQAGPGPYCFYGQRDSLTLCFALREVIPIYETPEQLMAASAKEPRLVVITQQGKRDNTTPPLAAGFWPRVQAKMEDQTVTAWRR